MSYFKGFPSTLYLFGNEDHITSFPNIGLYVDVIDQIKDNASFYNYYTIKEGDRPDNVSQNLYNTPDLYWTFFLLNDNIREQGWPLTNRQIVEKAQKDYPYVVLNTTDQIATFFDVGQTVTGISSGATGVVVNKRLDFGQIIVDTEDTFSQTEIISSTNNAGVLELATITSAVDQYNAINHYEDDDGNWTDVDPFTGNSGLLLPVTNLEYYISQNDSLKEIKVFKPQSISNINRSFKKSLRL